MSKDINSQFDYSIYNLIRFLWGRRAWIIAISLSLTLLAALWSLSVANTYKSETVLSPTEEAVGAGLNNIAGQLGGLASLAGLSVGGETTDQVTVALEIIKSRQFIAGFVKKLNIKAELFAVESWDRESDTLSFNPDIYDPASKSWTREPLNGRPSEPTDLEVHERFLELLEVERDAKTGMVKVAVEFYSPALSKFWLESLVAQVNREMRLRELETTRENIEYLEEQITKINDVEMRTVFFQLIQEQTKNLMLAEVRTDFVFSTIDPAFVPELKYAPKRALICLLVAFLSGFLVVVWFTLLYLLSPREA